MQDGTRTKSRRRSLARPYRDTIAALVEKLGQVEAATLLGISVQTLGAVAAGFAANNSTIECIESRLADLTAPILENDVPAAASAEPQARSQRRKPDSGEVEGEPVADDEDTLDVLGAAGIDLGDGESD